MTLNDDFHVDHLFLPIGKNPLPVFIAAWAQIRPGGRAYLLCSPATTKIAGYIRSVLICPDGENSAPRPDIEVVSKTIDTVDPFQIEKAVGELIRDFKLHPSDRAGLNFTGGTKPMVIHSLRKVMDYFNDPHAYYLDADTLKLHSMDKAFRSLASGDIRDEKQVILAEMVALQGGKIKGSNAFLTPLSPAAIDALIHFDKKAMEAWISWRRRTLNWVHLDKPWKEIVKRAGELPNEEDIALPGDEPLSRVTRALFDKEGPVRLGEAAAALSLKKPGDLLSWLESKWLEQYTWQCIDSIRKVCGLHDVYANVRPEYPDIEKSKTSDDHMEIDVVAIRGMQLFAFSCTSGNHVDTNKHKLFEVFTRARMLGGDEARLAVVSAVENPKAVETQLKEGWQTNQIKVFGRESLPVLSQEINKWIEDANKYRPVS